MSDVVKFDLGDEQSSALADWWHNRIIEAEAKTMVEIQRKLATMPKAEREAYMEAHHMYHGPHYDPTFEQDPAQWWRDYRAGKKPNAVDPYP